MAQEAYSEWGQIIRALWDSNKRLTVWPLTGVLGGGHLRIFGSRSGYFCILRTEGSVNQLDIVLAMGLYGSGCTSKMLQEIVLEKERSDFSAPEPLFISPTVNRNLTSVYLNINPRTQT